MNKCHSNLNWLNDTTPAINDTNLNYMDGCIDTIDDRVVTMDSTKLEAGNISTVIKNVSVNDSTGVFTFTRYDNSTFTVDTMLEKVVTNFGFDETTQKLTITLEDGTTKQVDLSSFIKETEVEDSDTVALSLVNHKLKATIKGNSITDAEMQTQYLTDCQSARNTATTAATASNTTRLQSEGYALGTQNGVEVGSDSIFYHNNARYYSDRASGSSLSALTDVDVSSVSDGQALTYDSASQKWVNSDLESDTDLLGDAWNSTTTYAVGSYCIYNNSLWKCKAQNVNTTPTEGTYWTSVTVTSEMSEYLPRVIHLSSIFTDTLPHIVKIGKTVIISGYFMNATSGSVTVSQNGVLMSGLPVPKKNIGTTARFSHTSEDVAIIVRTDGNLYFNHAAYTFSNYQGILIYCFAYETN